MEEDIKILEEFINYKNINNSPYHLIAISHERLCEAIQNLIARYKKLEEENRKLTARKYMLNAETGELKVIQIDNNYIPKSKVKELIQEKSVNLNGFDYIVTDDLQELLED